MTRSRCSGFGHARSDERRLNGNRGTHDQRRTEGKRERDDWSRPDSYIMIQFYIWLCKTSLVVLWRPRTGLCKMNNQGRIGRCGREGCPLASLTVKIPTNSTLRGLFSNLRQKVRGRCGCWTIQACFFSSIILRAFEIIHPASLLIQHGACKPQHTAKL